MGKITIEVKINTFGTMLYSLNHPNIYKKTKWFSGSKKITFT